MERNQTGGGVLNSRLSFTPLIEAWKKSASEGRPGTRKLYQNLLDRIRNHPELMEPIDDLKVLDDHAEWVEMLMTTLFPVTFSDEEDLYAVGVPFSYKVIYSSSLFRQKFLDEHGDLNYLPEQVVEQQLSDDKCSTAYKLILSKFYGQKVDGNVTSIIGIKNPLTGLVNYYEIDMDPTFIDVFALDALPHLNNLNACCSLSDVMKIDSLRELLPLDRFRFEGITIVRIKDVTQREVINNIKNILLENHSFDDSGLFTQLEKEMQTLIGMPNVKMGIIPFFKVNGHYVLEQYSQNKGRDTSDNGKPVKQDLLKWLLSLFKDSNDPVIYSNVNSELLQKHPFLGQLPAEWNYSAILFPLKSNGELIGILSATHETPDMLKHRHITQIMPSIPLFILALEKAAEAMDNEVDKVIKRHFTAVQSSVEWKFTEAAMQYLVNKKQGIKAKIDPIFFDHVFPLYGAIDIRNSSIERNNAIQLDLIDQLSNAGEIIRSAQQQTTMPLLQEVAYRIDKYLFNVSNILFSGDEVMIDNFLKNEVIELFEHLRIVVPSLSKEIDDYFNHIDSRIRLRVDHRHDFEESIMLINQELARFIDQEQEVAQRIYPHYFERFVTDGIDFNMYIGQSISPDKPFDTFYLKNLKMWQLTTLAKAAQMVQQLQDRLSTRLQTTQLILAHSIPISISFRTAERKFDVDGAYNIRYEIIKKRIDKVHVKGSHERLTQPGRLAIVFSQSKEAAEYLDYIEFLQNQKILLHDLEQLELEELQGVIGLKALRVGINMDVVTEKQEPRIKPQIIEAK